MKIKSMMWILVMTILVVPIVNAENKVASFESGGEDAGFNYGDGWCYSQTFIIKSNLSSYSVKTFSFEFGSAGVGSTLAQHIAIYNGTSTTPDKLLLNMTPLTFDVSAWKNYSNPSGFTLFNNTIYHLLVKMNSTTGGATFFRGKVSSAGGYADGQLFQGASCTAMSGYGANYDWNFRIYSEISSSVNLFSFNGSSIPANNSQFLQNYINISQNASLTNNTMNCSLILDGSSNQTKQYSNLTNQSYTFQITYDKSLSYGLHNYSMSCKSLVDNTTTNTSASFFTLYQFNTSFRAYELITNSWVPGNFTNSMTSNDSLLTNSGLLNVSFASSGYYPMTQTFNVSGIGPYNFTSVFNSKVNVTAAQINGSAISNFSVSVSATGYNLTMNTTTGLVIFNLTKELNYTFILDSALYELKNQTLFLNETERAINFSVYTTNSINFTFKNDVTKAIINNVTFELISTMYSNNYSTTTGSAYLDLLSPTTYTIRYVSPGYTTRFYVFSLTNRTTNLLTLYLSSNTTSSACTITVVDEANKPIENAYVKTYKYDLNTNSYLLQEIIATNFEGKASADLLLNTEYYKFIVEYPFGTIVLETTPTYIYSTTLRFQIITAQTAAENYFNLLDINHYLIFNNDSNNFRFFYSYDGTDLSQACLRVYRTDTTETLINTSCASTASATLLVGVANETGSSYRGDAYVTLSGEEYLLRSYIQEFPEASGGGTQGWWFVLILTAVMIPIFMWDKTLGLIATPLPTLLFAYMNFIDLPTWIALSMEIVFIIIAYWVSKK